MGALDRLILRDEQCERMSANIIGDERTRGSSGRDNRLFVEAAFWIARTGSPWRDIAGAFGDCNGVFRRFDPDFEYLIADSTIISTLQALKKEAESDPWRLTLQPEHQYPHGRARSRLPGVLYPFSRLKQFRHVATRFEKTARNYLAIVTIAATVLWLR